MNDDLRLLNPPRCATCKSWDQRYPQNKDTGVCRRMGAIQFDKEVAVLVVTDDSRPTSDFSAVRTRSNFGCKQHSDFLLTQYEV